MYPYIPHNPNLFAYLSSRDSIIWAVNYLRIFPPKIVSSPKALIGKFLFRSIGHFGVFINLADFMSQVSRFLLFVPPLFLFKHGFSSWYVPFLLYFRRWWIVFIFQEIVPVLNPAFIRHDLAMGRLLRLPSLLLRAYLPILYQLLLSRVSPGLLILSKIRFWTSISSSSLYQRSGQWWSAPSSRPSRSRCRRFRNFFRVK